MRVLLTASVVFLLLCPAAFPFFTRIETSAANLAIGGGDLCNLNSPAVALSNPACIGMIRKGFLHSSYKSYYRIGELPCYSVSLMVPHKLVGGGFHFESFGERSFYQEQEFRLSLGGRIYSGLCLGASFKYLKVSIQGGRFSAHGTSGDIGFGYDSGRGFLLGLCLGNLLAEATARDDFDLEMTTRMGIGISPYKKLYFSLSYSRSEGMGCWHLGQEISLSEYVQIRLGLRSDPSRYTAGLGLGWERFALDLAYESHPVLGATSQIDLRLDLFSRERR